MMISALNSVFVTLLLSLASSANAAMASDRDLKKGDKIGKAKGRSLEKSRTTLVGMEAALMSAEETMFFEDSWIDAWNDIYGGPDSDYDLRAFIVKSAGKGDDRRLSGVDDERSLYLYSPGGTGDWSSWGGNFFEFYAIADFGCHLCGSYDDDDRRLSKADDRQANRLFEDSLCGRLREGPFETFSEVDECIVSYQKTK